MLRFTTARAIGSAVALALLAAAPAAAEPNVVTVRLESIDALLALAHGLGKETPLPASREQIVGALPLGLPDGRWLDSRRPVAAALPQSGLLAAAEAFVVAVPLGDVSAARAALAARYPRHDAEGEVRAYADEDGSQIFARFASDYVVAGKARESVAAFDLEAALARRDLPAGPIAAEILVEPLAPLLQLLLVQGRAALKEEAEAGVGLVDLALDLVGDATNNVSRIQLGARLAGEHVVVTKRIFPRAASTLVGLLEGQAGALPEIARFAEPAGAAVVLAGQLVLTPTFREALRSYAERYSAVVAAEQSSGLGGWIAMTGKSAATLLDCYRGDFVSTLRLGPDGPKSVSLAGIRDLERCAPAIGTGIVGDVLLTVSGGSGSDGGFRSLADRIAGGAQSAGVEAGLFAPIAVGPGFFARVDLDGIGNGVHGVAVAGARVEPGAVIVEVALPRGLWSGEAP